MTACVTVPRYAHAIDTQYCGKPCRKLVVPSSGSMIHTCSASSFSPLAVPSSARIAWSGYAPSSVCTIAASAARSISLTKSFGPFVSTFSRSMSRAPRLMMLPALRAALTAVVSIGCMIPLFYAAS